MKNSYAYVINYIVDISQSYFSLSIYYILLEAIKLNNLYCNGLLMGNKFSIKNR